MKNKIKANIKANKRFYVVLVILIIFLVLIMTSSTLMEHNSIPALQGLFEGVHVILGVLFFGFAIGFKFYDDTHPEN